MQSEGGNTLLGWQDTDKRIGFGEEPHGSGYLHPINNQMQENKRNVPWKICLWIHPLLEEQESTTKLLEPRPRKNYRVDIPSCSKASPGGDKPSFRDLLA